MRYIIEDRASGLFWTGAGWSPHIGEALSRPGRAARQLRHDLGERFDLRLRLVPAPSEYGDDE